LHADRLTRERIARHQRTVLDVEEVAARNRTFHVRHDARPAIDGDHGIVLVRPYCVRVATARIFDDFDREPGVIVLPSGAFGGKARRSGSKPRSSSSECELS
jgi:hypothetical protein